MQTYVLENRGAQGWAVACYVPAPHTSLGEELDTTSLFDTRREAERWLAKKRREATA